MTQFTLRTAGPDDARSIAALHIASWQTAYRGLAADAFLDQLDLDDRTALWQQHLAEPDTTVILAESHELHGFCAFGPSRDSEPELTWQIYNLHIAPHLRRSGLGTVLFDRAVAAARQAGATALTLWVLEANTPAIRFYHVRGMHPDGARELRDLGPGCTVPEVRYRMTL